MNSPTPDSEVAQAVQEAIEFAHSEAIKCLRSKGKGDGIHDVQSILTALEKLVTPMVQELAEELEALIIASEENKRLTARAAIANTQPQGE